MTTENNSSRNTRKPDQRREDVVMKKAGHSVPNSRNLVPNKVRTESLYLLKMQVIRSYQSRVYLVRTTHLPTVWQIWTYEKRLHGTATLSILCRLTCRRKETMRPTNKMVEPDFFFFFFFFHVHSINIGNIRKDKRSLILVNCSLGF